jgi:hypothetical protein
MISLSGDTLIRIWETGAQQHPIDRALTILAAALPDVPCEVRETFSVGQRDSRLLWIWEQTFGPALEGYAECPHCRERLEFRVDAAQIRVADDPSTVAGDYALSLDGYDLQFRLLNSRDLAAAASCATLAAARHELMRRCVLQAAHDGAPIDAGELPAEVSATLAARMAECDPQAEVLLGLQCPGCGCGWQELLDIVTFLWAALAAQAHRLLRDVHVLAQAYGWREADILALSAARRQFYLEMVT